MPSPFKPLVFIFLFFTYSISAQNVPHLFNYQGVVRDAKGNPLSKQTLGLKISVLAAEGVTEAEYEEVQTVTTNEYGLYTLQIGNGIATKGEMKMVTWETGNKYIRVAIDPKGGTDYVDMGTTQLLSVPYAIYADRAGTAKNGGVSNNRAANNFIEKTSASGVLNSTSQIFDNGTNIGIGTTSPAAKMHLNASSGIIEHRIQSNGGSPRLSFFGDSSTGFTSTANYALIYKRAATDVGNFAPGFPNAKLFVFGNAQGSLLLNTGGNVGFGFFNQATNTTTTRVFVEGTSGNMGIGTSVPKARLHVVGSKDTVAYFTSNSTNLVTGVLRAEYIGVGSSNDNVAIYGKSISNNYNNVGIGLMGEAGYIGAQGIGKTKSTMSVYGMLGDGVGAGDVFGVAGFASNDSLVNNGTKIGVYGFALGGTNNYAGYFDGNAFVDANLNVVGNISKGAGTFKIDHPLDPENKFLYHSFVESPDMMNIYNGNVITDANGKATVFLPDYFEALNKDFRYQLTPIGQPVQLWISRKVSNNSFEISSSSPHIEVSWQITGIRKDPYANSNRVIVEVEKSDEEKGKYLHPAAYGKKDDNAITPKFPKPKRRVNN